MQKSLVRRSSTALVLILALWNCISAEAQRGGGAAGGRENTPASSSGESSSTRTRSDSVRRRTSSPSTTRTTRSRETQPNPTSAAELVEQASGYVDDAKYDDAVRVYNEVIRRKPGYFDALYGLGWALNEAKRYPEAVSPLTKALEVEPGSAKTLFELGYALRHVKRYDEAIARFRAALVTKPDYVEALYQIGWINNDRERYSAAVSELNRAINARNQYPEAYAEVGYSYKKLGRYAEAEAAYRQAVTQKPGYSDAHVSLGDLYFYNLKKYKEAADSYERGLGADTDNATALYNLGWSYNDLGNYNRALASLRRAAALQPSDSKIQVESGYAYRKLGEAETANPERANSFYRQAVNAYKEGIRLKNDSVSAYTGLGDVYYYSMKQYSEAADAYAAAARLSSNSADPRVLFNLGWSYNDLKRYGEAITVLRQAVSLKPENAEAHNELGWSYQQQQQFNDAIAAYREAVRLKPDYALAHYNLGLVLMGAGRRREAMAEQQTLQALDRTRADKLLAAINQAR
jgi:tetratricopeptide (TPR) repeat protein